MTCLHLPQAPDPITAADQLIVACSGIVDWRPNFLLGAGTFAVVVLLLTGLVWVVRR